ncbi:FAD binding domain-containing protein [Marinicella sp. W31]|uniref:FAD binding domain-containing protein n=1 Tax=Marinicella sp. W31 TaxID=3023713 RepID=UPI0037578017
MSDIHKTKTAIVIGGSLGGLFVGTMLRTAGWEVHIYERSKQDLDSRGGGIVLQPDVVEVLRRTGIDVDSIDLGVTSLHRTTWRQDGKMEHRSVAPQTQTSWSLIYQMMKEKFPDENYHQNKNLIEIKEDSNTQKVTAAFGDGSEVTGDLLIGADGNGSTVRQLLWPNDEPSYAGYLAWRGLVEENKVPEQAKELLGNFDFANHRTENGSSHMLGYLVPGKNNNTRTGHRLYNWVWYRIADAETLADIMVDTEGRQLGYSVPEGKLRQDWVLNIHADADEFLPPNFRAMVKATDRPFAQAIRDLTVDTMVKGRVILLGDAAFIPRPHTAASTSKAAFNAIVLAEALKKFPNDIDTALKAWEPQQMILGQKLFQQGSAAGDRLMFI